MYFFNKGNTLCHILEDEQTGKAPAPCGAQAGKTGLISLRNGRPTSQIVAEKPAEIPLCKHCQKSVA